MERTYSWAQPVTAPSSPVPLIAAYYDAVIIICELAAQFSDEAVKLPE